MLYFLLTIIAIGVLLASEGGRILLGFFIKLIGYLIILLIIVGFLRLGFWIVFQLDWFGAVKNLLNKMLSNIATMGILGCVGMLGVLFIIALLIVGGLDKGKVIHSTGKISKISLPTKKQSLIALLIAVVVMIMMLCS